MYSHQDALTTFANFVDSIQRMIDRVKTQRATATTEGLQLYNLGEFNRAKPLLLIGATDSDKDAQYALAESIRRSAAGMTEEARRWYQKAADQDHVYALLRLGDGPSLKKAKTLIDANVDSAMGCLQDYELNKNIESLRKSEQAGSAEAKYILAGLYGSNENLVPAGLTPSKEIKRLYLEAATAGLPKAMSAYSNLISVRNDKPIKRLWLEKRLELNDVSALISYALALSTEYDMDEDEREYGYEEDLVTAYALLWLVVDTTREFRRHTESARNLRALESELTAAQIAQAKQQAQTWKLSHPPMSEYRLTYSDVI
ncbi:MULTISPECIES: tetratricopeptide repeat protein [unclassified Pseudomonas]|uniref:tetratricopeptide repeat protein n=1 Tax=unclassified Pseudomonas TaxID=196821 RepID=UPI0030DBCD27